MDIDNDDLLIDHLQFNELLKYQINLTFLSARPRNALNRALFKNTVSASHSKRFDEMKKLNFIELQDIAHLRVSDIRDLTNVGEPTLVVLIRELQVALTESFQGQELIENIMDIDSIEVQRLRITTSRTIEELTESMIHYLKTKSNINNKEEDIWRNRLPWITEQPRTLDSIGVELGLTRERIRQIQRKSSKYSFMIYSKIFVLSEIQNILLECTNFEEFREAMIEEELTQEESITIGRIRHLAVALGQTEVVSEVEKAIYTWSQG